MKRPSLCVAKDWRRQKVRRQRQSYACLCDVQPGGGPLAQAGICRRCRADIDLAAEVRAELGPNASPEQITERMGEIAEDRGRRLLAARVRRVMETVA